MLGTAGVCIPTLTALLVLGDGLDHGAKDVRVDLDPVQPANVQQVGPGDLAESRHLVAAGEQLPVDVGEVFGPSGNLGCGPVLALGVHRAKQRGDDFMRVGRVFGAHLSDGFGEAPFADEDVGVLGEEAENQPRHELVHVVPTLRRAPFRVVLQQFDVQAIQAAGGPDVEGVLADLADGADARQRQEEAEVIGKVFEGAGDCLAAGQVFGLEVRAVRSKDELRLGLGRRRAGLEGGQRLRDPPCVAGQDVDVAGLENTAKIGLVRRSRAQAFDGGRLVAKGFEEGVGELCGVKGPLRKVGDGLFDFYGVHGRAAPSRGEAAWLLSFFGALMSCPAFSRLFARQSSDPTRCDETARCRPA